MATETIPVEQEPAVVEETKPVQESVPEVQVSEYDHPSELPDDIRNPGAVEETSAASPTAAPSTPALVAGVEFDKLPDKWLVPDGNGGHREVRKEEIASILPHLENVTGWQKAFTERDTRVKEERRQLDSERQALQNDWSMQVRDLAYRDPTFYQELAQAFNRRVNPAASQPQVSYDLPPEVKGDPVAEALSKQFRTAMDSVNSRVESVIQAKDQQLQDALNRVQGMELILGHQSRAQQMGAISEKAKTLGIVPDAGFLQRVQEVESRNGLRLYDDNLGNPSAFGTAVTEILARRLSGSSQSSASSERRPQPTMPVRGSARVDDEPISREEEFGFRAFLQETGGKGTVGQFRREMERFNTGR